MTLDIRQTSPDLPDEDSVNRYLAGESDALSAAALEAWGGYAPDGTPRTKVIRDIVAKDTTSVQSAQRLQQRVHAQLTRGRERSVARFRSGVRPWITGAAVTVLLVITAVIGFPSFQPRGQNDEVTIVTSYGERSRFQLPDGSMVLLGPGSTLRYPRRFDDRRVITLDGEALFTVTQSEGNPFVVEAGAATARVLGTSFTVRRYTTDAVTQIVVAEGKVAVSRNDTTARQKRTVLTTGEQALVPDSAGIRHERVADIGAALGWTQGKLVYQRTPLHHVITDMQRKYDVTILLGSSSLGQQRFTGVIDQPIATDAIALLAATFDLTVRRQNRTFTLGE